MNSWVLALDTSAYTTSLAALSTSGELISEQRRMLPVALGERGLRQGDAVFAHLKALPELLTDMNLPLAPPLAVGVSIKPRPLEGSYMPVFVVGTKFAEALATAWHCPLYCFSHQEGHIMAGIASSKGPTSTEFLALHLSGGTTELLKVQRRSVGFSIELLGASSDLHVGQFVDRVGVAIGLSFPAGPALEKLAATLDERVPKRLPIHCRELSVSFSGAEAEAQRWLAKDVKPEVIARAVEQCISDTLVQLIRNALKSTGLQELLLVGGVVSNGFIRQELLKHLQSALRLFFAAPSVCSDNAFGLARLVIEQLRLGE